MHSEPNSSAAGSPLHTFGVSDEHAQQILAAITESIDALCNVTVDVEMAWDYPKLSNSPTAHWAANNMHNTMTDDVGLHKQLNHTRQGFADLADIIKRAALRYQTLEQANAKQIADTEG
ncbi:hypothetical protein [Amycolatopsis sp. 195334CR]|uniref:hypothetical protein n=1 Tax=Amycolatopsis sp. 195334CR TaxID=2814588 RepID=UPI001A8D5DEF|nr:hypothetical protein [Amycolatopsis sp. 195334CR]MBN6040061.1 hypothetical protein [Amycolatopsis sp. 195334CR]